MRKIIVTVIFAVAAGAAFTRASSSVVLSGIVKDCFQQDNYRVKNIPVAAFDLSTNQKLDSVLKWMATINLNDADSATFARYDNAAEVQILGFIRDSSASARDTSAQDGSFTLTISPMDSVIVLGGAPMEDEPYYFASKRIGGQSNASLVLDMSRGHCGS